MIFTYTSPALWLCLISFACLRLTFCKLYLFLNRKPEESSTEIWQNLIKIGTSAFEGLCSNLESTFTHHKTPHTRAPQFHSLRKQKSEIRKQKTEHWVQLLPLALCTKTFLKLYEICLEYLKSYRWIELTHLSN